jgi:small subunit ribosomal protein S17
MSAKNKIQDKGRGENSCSDKKCPIHGESKLRGRSFVGSVTSDKMSKTVVVSWTRKFFVKKFERYERRQSKINAHNPECMNAKKGDVVRITETRPLSKTKHFIVTEVLGAESKKDHIKVETIEAEEIKEAPSSKKREDAKSEEE